MTGMAQLTNSGVRTRADLAGRICTKKPAHPDSINLNEFTKAMFQFER
jgi:hypothetical protein